MSFVQCLWWTYSSPRLRLSRKRFLLHTEDTQVTVHFQYPVFTSFYKDTCTKNRQKTVNSFCKVKIEAWFLPCVCFINSPSSLHWYDSTRQLSSHFAWWLENVSFTLLRLKSSLNRVSLWMEKKLHQLEKQTLNSQLKRRHIDHINSVNSPPNHQDMVVYLEVLHCQLQTGHSTKTPLMEGRRLT